MLIDDVLALFYPGEEREAQIEAARKDVEGYPERFSPEELAVLLEFFQN